MNNNYKKKNIKIMKRLIHIVHFYCYPLFPKKKLKQMLGRCQFES